MMHLNNEAGILSTKRKRFYYMLTYWYCGDIGTLTKSTFLHIYFLRKMGVIIPAALMMSSKSILGVNMLKIADEKPMIMQVCLNQLMELYLQKKIQVIVGKVYNVKDISSAHKYLESGSSIGKISVVWD